MGVEHQDEVAERKKVKHSYPWQRTKEKSHVYIHKGTGNTRFFFTLKLKKQGESSALVKNLVTNREQSNRLKAQQLEKRWPGPPRSFQPVTYKPIQTGQDGWPEPLLGSSPAACGPASCLCDARITFPGPRLPSGIRSAEAEDGLTPLNSRDPVAALRTVCAPCKRYGCPGRNLHCADLSVLRFSG